MLDLQLHKTKIIAVALLLVGLLLRSVYAHYFALPYLLIPVDPAGYHQLAVNLLDGNGFCLQYSADFCLPNLVRTPGYPIFIAGTYQLVGRDPAHVVIVQIMLDGVAGLLIGWSAWRLTDSKRTALLGILMHMLNPNAWMFSASILTEFLLSLLLLLLLALLIEIQHQYQQKQLPIPARLGFLFGLICAFAIYLKPNLIFLPIVLAGYFLLTRSHTRLTLLTVTLCLVLLFPWLGRNWLLINKPILSTAFTDNFNTVSAVATLLYARGEVSHPFTDSWNDVYYGEVVAPAGKRFGPFPAVDSAEDAYLQLKYVNTIAQEIASSHPAAFIQAHTDGFKSSWSVHEHRAWYLAISGRQWGDFSNRPEKLLGHMLYYIWWGIHLTGITGCLLAFWCLPHARQTMLAVIAIGILLTATAGPLANFRFRYPIEPAMTVYIAIGLGDLFNRLKRVY